MSRRRPPIASADYSQIELRIMAHISDDARGCCCKAFHDGMDVHRATAAEVFGVPSTEVSSEQRRYAKVINFGLIYGMSALGLARALAIDNTAARTTSSAISSALPGVKRYMDEPACQGQSKGYVERCLAGAWWCRKSIPQRPAPWRRARRHQRAHAGHGADLIKLSMNAVQQLLDANSATRR